MEVAEPASGLEDYADGNNWPFNFTEFFNSLLNFNHFIMVFYFCLFLVLVFSNHYVNWIHHEKTTLDDILVKHEVKNLQNFDANYDLALEQKARWPIFWTSILLTLMSSSGRVGFSFFYSCPFFPEWSWSRLYTPESYTQEAWPLPRSQSVQSAFGTWARHLVSYRSTNQNKRSERFFYGNHATSCHFYGNLLYNPLCIQRRGFSQQRRQLEFGIFLRRGECVKKD